MMFWVQMILCVLAVPVAVSMGVLILESLLALLPRPQKPAPGARRPRCAVLVPAHNEQDGIGATVKGLSAQLVPGDRLLVVADNCIPGDRTAEIARSLGAEVIERTDAEKRGKGYALDFGVRHLEKDPPAVVVIVDADCQVVPGSLEQMAQAAMTTGCPIQAAYTMTAPEAGGPKAQLSAFTFFFKNVARPLGMARLGMPCLLTGTGMAFPWALIKDAPLATGNLVEDMQLGIDLALAGTPPQFCADARVVSELPIGEQAARKQQTRWVHGHLQTILTQAPRLLTASVIRFRPTLLGLALELSVLPQSLLFLLWGALLAGLVLCWLLGESAWPALTLAGFGVGVFASLFLVWVRYGRTMLPFASLLKAPFFVLAKIPILFAFLVRRQKGWERTPRKEEEGHG